MRRRIAPSRWHSCLPPHQSLIRWAGRYRVKATISVDHRVSDGAEAAQFMQALAGFLENPVRMLV